MRRVFKRLFAASFARDLFIATLNQLLRSLLILLLHGSFKCWRFAILVAANVGCVVGDL